MLCAKAYGALTPLLHVIININYDMMQNRIVQYFSTNNSVIFILKNSIIN